MSTKMIAIIVVIAFLMSFGVMAMAKDESDPDDKPDSCKTTCGYAKKDCIANCDLRSKNLNDECHLKCLVIVNKCKKRCPDND